MYIFRIPKYRPESSPVALFSSFSATAPCSRRVGVVGVIGEVSSRGEVADRDRYEVAGALRRFTSIPMKVLGAHEERAEGIPQSAMRNVAKRKECANGVSIIELLKRIWPQIQAVRRSGRYLLNFVSTAAIAAGGRLVKFSSSGDMMRTGSMAAPTKTTEENTTKAKLPIRPISPNASFDCLTS